MKVFYDNEQIVDIDQILTKEQIEDIVKDLIGKNFDEAKIKVVLTKEEKQKQITDYIYQYYPPVKQQSDTADKVYYETLLKSKGTTNLEADIVNRTTEFYNGKSLEEVIADVDDGNKVAYEQLIKVAIRTKFVQDCKAELKQALSEDREPNFPKYPL